MPKICYRPKKFGAERMALIDQANVILEEYAAKGFDLTLRQLYYQFVARGFIENSMRSYKRLGDIIDGARLAGLIDWNRIEDRTRNLRSRSNWNDPREIIRDCFYSYHIDRWQNQDYRLEVWCEKEALIGIFARICNEFDVPYFACRGYVSQSEMWRAAMRLEKYRDDGQTPIILHFGDHDPSGIDMSRDIEDRLAMFLVPTKVDRLALNMGQEKQFDPPPNPAKQMDARFQTYVLRFGDESWELDALQPEVLTSLVRRSVNAFRDIERWKETVQKEQRDRATLSAARICWPKVWSLLNSQEKNTVDKQLELLQEKDPTYKIELEDDEEDLDESL